MRINMSKLLTIVIPTYNRADLLKYTMELMAEQINRNAEYVDVIICDNASIDHTKDIVSNIRDAGISVQYKRYNEHVSIGNSISRSVENVKTPYFQLWSDDDLPSPMMIDMILNVLRQYPNVGAISFNRINGNGYSNRPNGLYDLRVFTPTFEHYIHYYESSQQYAEDRYTEVDFVSINVISLQAWKKGMQIYTDDHFGFQFVAPLLYGVQGLPCIYLEYPLCIKRDPPIEQISYAVKWPLYAYVGMPRVLKTLQDKNVIKDAKELFANYRYNLSNREYIETVMQICYKNKDIYAPYVEEMVSYQVDKQRIFFTKAILWPKVVKKILRKIYRMAIKFKIVK